MTVGENIKKLREANAMTQEDFGKIAGVSSMAVSQWENNRAVPRMGAIQRIADAFGVSKGELIDDYAEVIRGALTPVSYEVVGSVEVPVYGKVHAGKPMEHDEVNDTRRVPDFVAAIDPDLFILHSEGDCLNKIIAEEDDLAVSPNTKPKNGDIVVACIDGMDYIVRRFFKTDQTLILSPESYNPAHKDIIITADSDHTVELPGVVIWHQARELMI